MNYFKVTSVKNGIESDFSSDVSATTPSTKFTAPTGLTATAISFSEINVQWNKIDGINGYYLYLSTDKGITYKAFTNSDGSKKLYPWVTDHSVNVTGIPSNFTDYFKVTSVNNGVESDFSNVASATTFSSSTPTSSIKGPLKLISDDGKSTYLGKLTSNKYDLDSVFNSYGSYGSKYASNSIYNKYGSYGSKYSTYSAFNDYTSTPPKIVNSDGVTIGRLTTNKFVVGAINPNEIYNFLLKSGL